jgi:hypothetical protein
VKPCSISARQRHCAAVGRRVGPTGKVRLDMTDEMLAVAAKE